MALAVRVRELFRFDRRTIRAIESRFIVPEIAMRNDVAERRAKLASVIAGDIIPYLVKLHRDAPIEHVIPVAHPDEANVEELAHILLGPESDAAMAYVAALRARGISTEMMFDELLAPTATLLGEMWERDECDFVDVTLGVARLQKLLAFGNATHTSRALVARRRALMAITPGEQHFFGASVIEKFLSASRWMVETDYEPTFDSLTAIAKDQWFALAGLSLGSDERIDALTKVIRLIRRHSQNPAIRIMVGGAVFNRNPDLVRQVGADASATSATAAVLIAQKLFDEGELAGWGMAVA